VTEAEWLACDDPNVMLLRVRENALSGPGGNVVASALV
jgi:hypothetical protein